MKRRWNWWNHFATATNGSGQAGGGGGALSLCCWKFHVVTAVLLLTGVNVYLLIQLLACNGRLPHVMPPTADNSVASASSKLTAALAAMVVAGTTGRRDASSQFVIRDHFVSGERFEATALEHGVCLATQSSLDRLLRWFPQAADHWRGAASVALFLEGAQEAALFASVVRHLRRCHDQFWSDVSFHIVVAASDADVHSSLHLHLKNADDDDNPPTDAVAQLERTINCSSNPSKAFAWILGDSSGSDNRGRTTSSPSSPMSMPWTVRASSSVSSLRAKWLSSALRGGKIAYPQNLMRNVARKGCPSSFVLLLDVDVIPSLNMAQSLSAFLLKLEKNNNNNNNKEPVKGNKKNNLAVSGPKNKPRRECLKCAFVLPTYELDDSSVFPRNKSQLLQLVADGRAQPFHHKAFRFNQYASNLTRWEQFENKGSNGQTPDVVAVSHDVTNYEFFYEPFYVARDNAPPHDERFVGYGFTRNTQVYEMALSDWSFHVLSPIFTIHWGLQMKQQRRLPAWRKRQMEKNRLLFDGTVHQELKVKYSNATLLQNNSKGSSSPSSVSSSSSSAAAMSSAIRADGSGVAGRWRGIVESRPSPVNAG